jgi:hypothetical protein
MAHEDIKQDQPTDPAPSQWTTRQGIERIYGHLPPQIYEHIMNDSDYRDIGLLRALLGMPEITKINLVVTIEGKNVELNSLDTLNAILGDIKQIRKVCAKLREEASNSSSRLHEELRNASKQKDEESNAKLIKMLIDVVNTNTAESNEELIRILILTFSQEFEAPDMHIEVLRNGGTIISGLALLKEVVRSPYLISEACKNFRSMANIHRKVIENDFLPPPSGKEEDIVES